MYNIRRPRVTNFIALAKPAWFKRRTVKLEVEEWMRSITKSSLFGMTMFVEQGATDMNKMYKDLPVELDAHKIEDSRRRQDRTRHWTHGRGAWRAAKN